MNNLRGNNRILQDNHIKNYSTWRRLGLGPTILFADFRGQWQSNSYRSEGQTSFEKCIIFQSVFKGNADSFPLELFYQMFNLILKMDEPNVVEVKSQEVSCDAQSENPHLTL